jgi:hypothetical protein
MIFANSMLKIRKHHIKKFKSSALSIYNYTILLGLKIFSVFIYQELSYHRMSYGVWSWKHRQQTIDTRT